MSIFPSQTGLTKISVLVADADPMGARLLATELRRQRGLQVSECAADPSVILDTIGEAPPQILLLSETLSGGSLVRLALLKQLHAEHPITRTIVLLDPSQPDVVAELFRAGARGVFDRCQFDIKSLCRSIRCVAAGQVWASSEQIAHVLDTFSDTASLRIVSAGGEELLTRRERDVVRLVAEGLVNREVAQQLRLSEHTIKNYLFNVFNKLGISSRAELIAYAVSNSDNRILRPELPQPPQPGNGNGHCKLSLGESRNIEMNEKRAPKPAPSSRLFA
jgi:DNA-binding NarL/FixJ family response regulator